MDYNLRERVVVRVLLETKSVKMSKHANALVYSARVGQAQFLTAATTDRGLKQKPDRDRELYKRALLGLS